MNTQQLTATFSWDDGHPSDLRIAQLFSKYGVSCTFFVPKHNSENLSTLSISELKDLSRNNFDIHSHTLNHVYLAKLTTEQQAFEIQSGKKYIEDAIGKEDDIFCYPGGKYTQKTVELVKEAGFAYARTVDMGFDCAYSPDNYRMPTTSIIAPLTGFQILKHSLKRLSLRRGYDIFRINRSITNKSWKPQRTNESRAICYHFWGHSWEIDKHDLWECLEVLIQSLVAANAEIVTNKEFYTRRRFTQ